MTSESTGSGSRSTAEAAAFLISCGMHPVPVPFKAKKAVLEGWPDLRMTEAEIPEHFNGKPQNIGVILGIDGLCDIDLDCVEAIRAAEELLPPTGFVFGRDSRPRSHRLYWLDNGVRSQQFKLSSQRREAGICLVWSGNHQPDPLRRHACDLGNGLGPDRSRRRFGRCCIK